MDERGIIEHRVLRIKIDVKLIQFVRHDGSVYRSSAFVNKDTKKGRGIFKSSTSCPERLEYPRSKGHVYTGSNPQRAFNSCEAVYLP